MFAPSWFLHWGNCSVYCILKSSKKKQTKKNVSVSCHLTGPGSQFDPEFWLLSMQSFTCFPASLVSSKVPKHIRLGGLETRNV